MEVKNRQLAEIAAKQDGNKKENKKAIKGLAILVILGALGGGLVGWFSAFGAARQQQLLVDLAKVMYPEKNGSVYDLNFNEKWEDSCDEFEKLMIYKASYKAYRTDNGACCIALIAIILLSFIFDYGPLPALIVGTIWASLILSYALEAMKLEKQRIN